MLHWPAVATDTDRHLISPTEIQYSAFARILARTICKVLCFVSRALGEAPWFRCSKERRFLLTCDPFVKSTHTQFGCWSLSLSHHSRYICSLSLSLFIYVLSLSSLFIYFLSQYVVRHDFLNSTTHELRQTIHTSSEIINIFGVIWIKSLKLIFYFGEVPILLSGTDMPPSGKMLLSQLGNQVFGNSMS